MNNLSKSVARSIRKVAAHSRSGDELHINYLVGHHCSQSVNLGIEGSYYQPLTEDNGYGAIGLVNWSRASTVGAALQRTSKLAGKEIVATLKGLYEYDVYARAPLNDFPSSSIVSF